MGESLRKEFLLDPEVTFLNHGSFGACPRTVMAEYQRWQTELERRPVEFLDRRFEERMEWARGRLATYIGANIDDIVYVPNATIGLNTVIRSLRLAPGDEILSTDHEYGALDRTWRFVCRHTGAVYVRHPLPMPVPSQDALVDALWGAVTPKTRVLFLSHITSPTALTLPIGPLVHRARDAGILTIVDGAHAPGQVSLDLDALGADVYAGNCHKWMMSPKGAGFLHVRRGVQHLVEPLVVSWGWESERPSRSRFVDLHQWQGTRDIAAFLSVPAAIDYAAERRWDAVRAACHAMLHDVRPRLLAVCGCGALYPDQPEYYTQMHIFRLPEGVDGERLKRRLYDEERIEIPVILWNGRWHVRVSVQGYNAPEDLDRLVDSLRRLLPTCRLVTS